MNEKNSPFLLWSHLVIIWFSVFTFKYIQIVDILLIKYLEPQDIQI